MRGGVAAGEFSLVEEEESEFNGIIRLLFCGNAVKRVSLRCPKCPRCPKIISFLGHLRQWGLFGAGGFA